MCQNLCPIQLYYCLCVINVSCQFLSFGITGKLKTKNHIIRLNNSNLEVVCQNQKFKLVLKEPDARNCTCDSEGLDIENNAFIKMLFVCLFF